MVRRFRSVGWVGCVAAAALGCYLVSQRVASERFAVEQLDRRIILTHIDIRKLQTELGTRSRMPVLEQWNAQVLALSAPVARQYLHGEVQLARFELKPAAPKIQAVAATAPLRPAAPVTLASATVPASDGEPMLRHATYVKTDGGLEASMRPVALLADDVLGDLKRTAQRETSGRIGGQ